MAIKLPSTIHAGDALTVSVSGFDGRQCKVTLNNVNGKHEATAVQSGNDWVAKFTSAETQNIKPSIYAYHIGLTQDGERETLTTGIIEVLPDVTANAVDTRSHARRVLDAIEATLEGKATSDHEETQINGRSIKRFPVEQLLTWRDKYRAEVVREQRKLNAKNGGLKTGIIHTRFN